MIKVLYLALTDKPKNAAKNIQTNIFCSEKQECIQSELDKKTKILILNFTNNKMFNYTIVFITLFLAYGIPRSIEKKIGWGWANALEKCARQGYILCISFISQLLRFIFPPATRGGGLLKLNN